MFRWFYKQTSKQLAFCDNFQIFVDLKNLLFLKKNNLFFEITIIMFNLSRSEKQIYLIL